MNLKQNTDLLSNGLKLSMIVFFTILMASCGNKDNNPPSPNEQELAQEILEATWSIDDGGSITLDNRDVALNYEGFSLIIGDGTFTTTNAGDLFPASGTWEWVGDTDNQITTGKGKEITITALSTSTFTFSFIKTNTNAVAGVSGNYSITVRR